MINIVNDHCGGKGVELEKARVQRILERHHIKQLEVVTSLGVLHTETPAYALKASLYERDIVLSSLAKEPDADGKFPTLKFTTSALSSTGVLLDGHHRRRFIKDRVRTLVRRSAELVESLKTVEEYKRAELNESITTLKATIKKTSYWLVEIHSRGK